MTDMLRRLDAVTMTAADRALARASIERAEATIDLFCRVGSSVKSLAAALSSGAGTLRRRLWPLEDRA